MPFSLTLQYHFRTNEGIPRAGVVVGGYIDDQRELDEAIGLMMDVRNKLGHAPSLSSSAQEAVKVVGEELIKMGLMDIAKEAHERREKKDDAEV